MNNDENIARVSEYMRDLENRLGIVVDQPEVESEVEAACEKPVEQAQPQVVGIIG